MYLNLRKWHFMSLLALSFAMGSCETVTEVSPQPEPPQKTGTVYTISKGKHYSDLNAFKQLSLSQLKFEVTFDSSAIYTSVAANNQADINKLYGLSDCNSSHHVNSARFGWRWYNDRLELLAYTYLNQKWDYKLLDTVPIGETVTCAIRMEEGKYVFVLNGKETEMPRACNGAGVGYQLYPYFGGDETAPHDISIRIRELE